MRKRNTVIIFFRNYASFFNKGLGIIAEEEKFPVAITDWQLWLALTLSESRANLIFEILEMKKLLKISGKSFFKTLFGRIVTLLFPYIPETKLKRYFDVLDARIFD